MRTKRYIGIFTFLLCFSELIGFRLWAAEEIGGPRITGFYTLLSIVISIGIGAAAGVILEKIMANVRQGSVAVDGSAHLNRTFWILWVLLFACYIPCFLAFYPGIFNNDMGWQWGMYVTKMYNTHHPILHTFLAGSLFELGKVVFGSYNAGLAIHSTFQLLILSGSAAFALRFLIKTGSSKKAFITVLVFYALYPYIPLMGLSTTKDAVFGAAFLIVFVMLCDMVQAQRLYSGGRLVLFFGFLVLSGVFRNNAVYGFLVFAFCLTVWALLLRNRHRGGGFQGRLALIFSLGVVVIQLCLMLLTGVFHAEKGKINEMFSVPCQQMARVYVYHGEELTEAERETLFRFIPEENLEDYNYYISDPVKNNLNEEVVKAAPDVFLKLWVRLGLQFPREYIEAFLNNTFGIWYLTGDTGSNLPTEYLKFFDTEHVFVEHSILPSLKQFYKWFHYTNYEKYLPVVSMVFYTPFFCWMTLFGGFAVLDRRRWELFTLPLFLLAYILTVALGPCVPVRYLFNIILSAPILLAVVWKPEHRIAENG